MFKGPESVLALDLGSSGIKAVEMAVERGKPVVKQALARDLPLPADGERGEGRPESLPRLITCLGDALAEMGIKPAKVKRLVTCLPAHQVSIKQIRSLALPEAEMRSALVFEARKHLPVEGDVLMDYQVLAKRGEELDVLLVVTTKQAVVGHLSVLEACGLKGGIIEAGSLALWNAYLPGQGAGGAPSFAGAAPGASAAAEGNGNATLPMGMVHVGAVSTGLSFFHGQGLFLTRDIPIAGDKFTDDLRQSLGLDFAAAEKAKSGGAMFRSEQAGKGASAAVLELEGEGGRGHPSLQSLAREIQRSIRFYLKESGQPRLGSLVLAGGAAADPGLRDYLQRELGLPIETFAPEAGHGAGPRFAQAIGMALRGLHEFFPNQLK